MSDPIPAETGRDRAVVWFATLQLFSLVYLQKFALGPSSFQFGVPMLIMFGSVAWMGIRRKVDFPMPRVASYFVFICFCLFSQILAGGKGSTPSFFLLALLYGCMTLSAELAEADYKRVLDTFIKFMILPAAIIIFQFTFQALTGLSNPLNMDKLFPSSMLLQGYIYEGPLVFGMPFMRPNGFFFLETSFASLFAAAATIVEITYFRRPLIVVLMLSATFLSLGGTGTTMIFVAVPFLLSREKPRVVAVVIIVGIIGLIVANMFNLPIPLISRVDELGTEKSSGSGRLLLPALELINLISNPSFLFTGEGPGSIPESSGSAWPTLKLIYEYGILTMFSFVIFFLAGIYGNSNLPLKVALSVTYHFTGGYLLSPTMVGLLIVLCWLKQRSAEKVPESGVAS